MYKLKNKRWWETSPSAGDYVIVPEALASGKPLFEIIASVEEVKKTYDYVLDDYVTAVYVQPVSGRYPLRVEADNLVYVPIALLKKLMEMAEKQQTDEAIKLLHKFVPLAAMPNIKSSEKGGNNMTKQEQLPMEEQKKALDPIQLTPAGDKWKFKVTGETRVVTGTAKMTQTGIWLNIDGSDSKENRLPFKHFEWLRKALSAKIKQLVENPQPAKESLAQ